MKNQNINVLFLTRYPVEGASSRYRVYQYLPYLKANGVRFQVSSFMSEKMYKKSFVSGKYFSKVVLSILATFKRLWVLRKYYQYDVIYMQRELLPFGPPILERLLKKSKTKIIFDYDDALFIHKRSTYNKAASFFRSADKTIKIFKTVDCVVAGNRYLKEKAKEYCDQVVILEVAEDSKRIQQRSNHTNKEEVTIGWLGSTSTIKYTRLISNALIRIHKKYPKVQFVFMGGDPDFQIPNLPIKHMTWSLDNELKALELFDIGIMPLPDEEWSKGKSGGKARTYMTAGVVAVCTGVGYNRELIKHGATGFLCNDEQQWYNALTLAIEDSELRQRIANNARAYVIDHFDLEKQAQKLVNILNAIVNAPDRAIQ